MVIAMQNQFNDEYMNNDNYAIDSDVRRIMEVNGLGQFPKNI